VLKDKPQFCCWKYEERSGRKTKVPHNPVTGKRAKPNQRGTFKDFSSAVAAISDYDGIGFLVGNDICVIDLDDCFDNSGKLGNTVVKRNEKLVKLMNSVGEMKLGDYKDNTIDAFGDAYEFLMGMYASNAGKSGGEYYTPQEVSELLTHLTLVGKTEVNKVYDIITTKTIQFNYPISKAS
jgi:hypothetical protein